MPALLPCSNGIILGLFYSPRGLSLPHVGCRSHGGTLRSGIPVLSLLPCHLGSPPLLKNKHLITRKKKKKTHEKEKNKLRSQPKALSQGNTIRNSGAAASLAGFPVGWQVGGDKPGWGAVTPVPNVPHHAPSPPRPTVATPKPLPPWELKGDLCLPLTLCFTVLEKGHKRDPNHVVFFKNFSIFSDVSPPAPAPLPSCWPGGVRAAPRPPRAPLCSGPWSHCRCPRCRRRCRRRRARGRRALALR